ncbi:MAG TPA: DinB family protein [Chloroflexota bacterium]|nr:DinB family protein [Chloroflexota bacterium]
MTGRTFAVALRALPTDFRAALSGADDVAVRHRPAPGEWSAIEVLGHMIDKMRAWRGRVQRIALEDQPMLPGYDQDAYVREQGYQDAAVDDLLDRFAEASEDFAALVDTLPASALERVGIHGETGPMTLRQCIALPLESAAAHREQLLAALLSPQPDSPKT